jgi:hypothetical protein
MRYLRLDIGRYVAMTEAPSAYGIYNSRSEEGALALLIAGRAFSFFLLCAALALPLCPAPMP